MSERGFSQGDRVSWNTSQGRASGRVERRVTHPMHIDGRHIAASPENPQYIVKSDSSGRIATHKPGALTHRGRHG